MHNLETFAEHIREQIPLTRHLDFQLLSWDGDSLRLKAGLAPNINDKGSLFAGSQTALLTLAGWAYTTLLSLPEDVDVVAAGSEIAFAAPIMSDAEFVAHVDAESRERFRQRLRRKGRAPLKLQVSASKAGTSVATRFTGTYLATNKRHLSA